MSLSFEPDASSTVPPDTLVRSFVMLFVFIFWPDPLYLVARVTLVADSMRSFVMLFVFVFWPDPLDLVARVALVADSAATE